MRLATSKKGKPYLNLSAKRAGMPLNGILQRNLLEEVGPAPESIRRVPWKGPFHDLLLSSNTNYATRERRLIDL